MSPDTRPPRGLLARALPQPAREALLASHTLVRAQEAARDARHAYAVAWGESKKRAYAELLWAEQDLIAREHAIKKLSHTQEG